MKSGEGFSFIKTALTPAPQSVIKRLRNLVFLLLIVITTLSFAFPTPVEAQGLAISGNFYRQHFQLLPGETLRTPDIYLVVFNHEDEDIRVKLTTQTPPGVEILLDQSSFPIPLGEHKKVEVGVKISTEAVPGEYLLSIAAEVQPTEGDGITIAGAAEQQAKLTILEGVAEVHATEDITSTAQKYSIYGFSVVPNYHEDTDKIAYANIEYAVKNIYQPLEAAKMILRVSFNDELLEETEIISLPTLDLGSASGSYKYIPSRGWQNGTYTFKLALISQDILYAQSPEEKLFDTMPATATSTDWKISWSLVSAAGGGLLVIVLIVFTGKRIMNKRRTPGKQKQ
jgi:hypothetical protein